MMKVKVTCESYVHGNHFNKDAVTVQRRKQTVDKRSRKAGSSYTWEHHDTTKDIVVKYLTSCISP